MTAKKYILEWVGGWVGVKAALRTAIKQRKNKDLPLIHHSDRGLQYCANDYQSILNKKYCLLHLKMDIFLMCP